ncbi:hypothetical protein B0H14DRAFT_3504171 [Mycena olivaceomarginata]|nr:hypothetical protein B0H14DRAFT_3504171 [Mycena olivaceomarginata]
MGANYISLLPPDSHHFSDAAILEINDYVMSSEASNSNPAAAAVIPDPYSSDGPGVNYLVTRDPRRRRRRL